MKVLAAIALVSFGLVEPALAQQRETNQTLADQKQAVQKNELQTFELVLRTAVDRGGQQFAAWAKRVAPEVMLAPVSPAVISSVPIPQRGTVFEIQIPLIVGTTYLVPRTSQIQRPQPGMAPPQAQPIAGKGNVMANNVQTADSMSPDPCQNMSPDQCYSEFVRIAVIDAMLDNSSVLTVKDDELLTVAAMGIDGPNTNPLYANTSRKLILHAKGADLNLLKQGKISRDEAKSRIVEIHF